MSINSPVDCGLTDSKDPTWMIAAHNPSQLEQRYIRLQAPFTAAYKVFVIDENQEWKWTPTDMLCFEATENNSEAQSYQTCELYIQATVPAQGQAHIKVEPCNEEDQGAAIPTQKMGHWEKTIGNSAYNIQYKG